LPSSPAAPTEKATLETIVAVRRWSEGLYSFTTTRPKEFRFTAGQYARLGLQDPAGNMVWRAYSIVSSTRDDCLEYYVIDVPDGLFTGQLRQKKEGDTIWVDKQSYGFMTADRFADGEDLWMLATGTGLGPFVSILQEPQVWERFRHLVLVHSVRHADEFAYEQELKALKGRQPFSGLPANLIVLQTATRDSSAAQGKLQGRITSLVENGELETHAGLKLTPEASRVMLCGNPQMIEDMRKILHERGMRPVRRALPGQFLTENYW
jgi:ferredoxin--NADP+ reductase